MVARLGLLREQWRRAWPRAWADPDERSAMIELHAWMHALGIVAGPARGLETKAVALPSAARLSDEIVRAELPAECDAGPFAPVLAARGAPSPRVERSRPGWHVSGEAHDVPWTSGVRALLVLAVDEGDNEVVMVVDASATGVSVVQQRRAASVRLDDVAVADRRLVHRPDVREALADRLTVLGLHASIGATAELVAEMSPGPDADRARAELELCRAATHVAAVSARSATPLGRQHDVSAAAVVTLSTSARVAGRTVVGGDLAWHRERLAPLL
jgi:hypothetical protein